MLRIKEILKEKGFTQEDLADRIGVTRISIVKTLSGNPTIKTLEKIATALDVPLRDLFDGEDKYNVIACPNCGEKINITVTKE